MFVTSLANLWAWTGDRRYVERHWDAARRILDWARDYGDMDGDGYLEYLTRSSKGTKNQGWKDSGDAIVYDDGTPVPAPIATCELQAYWYVAQELMAVLSWVMGAKDDAAAHRKSAAGLKERFNRDWWIEDEQFVALALDPDKRQVRAITSNVGHCLACGIIGRDRLPSLVERLFAPDLFSGWGIRTLSNAHAFYNPLSYHRGTVWTVEQATIVFGLRRFGFDARARSGKGDLRPVVALSRISDPGMRWRIRARRIAGAGRLSPHEHAAAVECDRVPVDRADAARAGPAGRHQHARARSCPARLDPRAHRPRSSGRECARVAAVPAQCGRHDHVGRAAQAGIAAHPSTAATGIAVRHMDRAGRRCLRIDLPVAAVSGLWFCGGREVHSLA
jgi:hypothetical protein